MRDAGSLLKLLDDTWALDDPAERSGMLDSLGDPDLRSALESLIALREVEATRTFASSPSWAEVSAPAEDFTGNDRFELRDHLGSGGFGTVYRVFDRERNTEAALKVLREREPGRLYRFKREFRLLADLRHRNLVRLYDLFAEGETWFFTMELVEGRSFDAAVAAGDLRGAFAQLASALHFLHLSGRLHLDVKPSNVMVDATGRVVLLDFGFVREIGPVEGARRAVWGGTPAYMAPEQIRRESAGAAADWYAAGVMLYRALAARVPFMGGITEMFAAKLAGPAPPVRSAAPDAPADLAALCDALLDRDPARRPEGGEILARLGRSAGEAAAPEFLIGREDQLAVLHGALEQVSAGSPATVQLVGRSGYGKSALLRRFLREAAEHPAAPLVLSGACHENEAVPFKALDEVIDALSQALLDLPPETLAAALPPGAGLLGRVFPVLGSIAPAPLDNAPADSLELRRRAFAALVELIRRLARGRPLVLAIDDLQWGDIDSAAFFGMALAGPDPPCVLLIASFREEEIDASECLKACGEALRRRDRSVGLIRIEVGPLDEESAADLAAHLLPDAGADVVREAAGSPLLLAQLAAYRRHAPAVAGLSAQQLIETRVRQLPDAARRLLETIALAAQPLPQTLIREAAGVDADDFSGFWTLHSERLIRTRERGRLREVHTYHDRVRETVASAIPPARRRALHLCLGLALERSGEEAALLAPHFAQAGRPDKAGPYALAAAEAAWQALAFDRAAEFYRMALEIGAGAPRDLQLRLAEAYTAAGRCDRAAAAYLEAAREAPSDQALDYRRTAAELLISAGRLQEGGEVIRGVMEQAGLTLPGSRLRALLDMAWVQVRLAVRGTRFTPRKSIAPRDALAIDVCLSLSFSMMPMDLARTAKFPTLALLLALRAGDPARVAVALAMQALVVGGRGWRSANTAQRLIQQALDLAGPLNRPDVDQVIHTSVAMLLALQGHWEGSIRQTDMTALAGAPGSTRTLWAENMRSVLAFIPRAISGDIAGIRTQLPRSLRALGERGNVYGISSLRSRIGYLTWLADDQPDRAAEEIRRGAGEWPDGAYLFQHYWMMFTACEVDLYRGDARAAWDRVQAGWGPMWRALIPLWEIVRAEVYALRGRCAIALAAADPARRDDLLRRAAKDAARLAGSPHYPKATAALLRAGIASVRGNRAAATGELIIAGGLLKASGMRLHEAASEWLLGRLTGGESGRARAAAAEAWMQAQGIRNPARMAAMAVPGFEYDSPAMERER